MRNALLAIIAVALALVAPASAGQQPPASVLAQITTSGHTCNIGRNWRYTAKVIGSSETALVTVELNGYALHWSQQRFIARHPFRGSYSGTIPCVSQQAWLPGSMASGVMNFVTIRVTSSSRRLRGTDYYRGIVRVFGAPPPDANGGLNSTTIVSGNGSYGSPDAVVQTSLDRVNWSPATVSACCKPAGQQLPGSGSDWDSITGTNWDSNPSGTIPAEEPVGVDIWFRVTFTLPAAFTTPSLAVTQFVDDNDIVLLNGTQIGRAPADQQWHGTPQQFATSSASLFHSGSNQLLFETVNNGGPGGLDFSVAVAWTGNTG